jgi:small GTP-binding protein
MHKPVVALVGRPNVGKSTLFNRLIGERKAVTSDIPGTTRDRILGESEWGGIAFTVIDTGGIEVYEPRGGRNTSPLEEGCADFVPQIRAQAMIAIEESDVVLMLVDADTGVTAADEEVAEILRRTNKPVIVAANKADSEVRRNDAVEFYALGVGEEMYPISAIHGTGTGDLLDAVVRAIRNAPPLRLVRPGAWGKKDALRPRPSLIFQPAADGFWFAHFMHSVQGYLSGALPIRHFQYGTCPLPHIRFGMAVSYQFRLLFCTQLHYCGFGHWIFSSAFSISVFIC